MRLTAAVASGDGWHGSGRGRDGVWRLPPGREGRAFGLGSDMPRRRGFDSRPPGSLLVVAEEVDRVLLQVLPAAVVARDGLRVLVFRQ